MMIRMVGGWVFLLVPAHPGSPRQRAVKQLLLLLLQLIKETEMTIQMWSACTTVVVTINNILLKRFSLPTLSVTEYFFYMPKSSLCIATLRQKRMNRQQQLSAVPRHVYISQWRHRWPAIGHLSTTATSLSILSPPSTYYYYRYYYDYYLLLIQTNKRNTH